MPFQFLFFIPEHFDTNNFCFFSRLCCFSLEAAFLTPAFLFFTSSQYRMQDIYIVLFLLLLLPLLKPKKAGSKFFQDVKSHVIKHNVYVTLMHFKPVHVIHAYLADYVRLYKRVFLCIFTLIFSHKRLYL